MTPLFKKLNFKAHPEVLIINPPESFGAEMAQMAAVTKIYTEAQLVAPCSFIMAFVTAQTQINALAPLLAQKLEGDGILWFCYPKGSSKNYKCDFNRDTGWQVLGAHGFEPVRMVAVDADWSALRFRKVQFIKNMTRSFAQSEEGKIKTATRKPV